uniref:RxLR effector protein n=1 Tax=Phytophthora brassicae TaxID=187813 RepID=A0A2L0WUE9_PHYBB|nr:RxLR27 effector [Phytophthora brassicae]
MHLHYILLVVMTVLTASSSIVSSASVLSDIKSYIGEAYTAPFDSPHARYEDKRLLRTSGKTTANIDEETGPDFIENKLKKALSNPKKTERLYHSWYKKGITWKDVSSELDHCENQQVNLTYKELSSGYAAYIEEQDALNMVQS